MRWAVLSVIIGCAGAPPRSAAPPAPVGNVAPAQPAPADAVSAEAAATTPAVMSSPAPVGCNAAAPHHDVLDVNADGQPDVQRFFGTDNGTDFVQCKLSDLNADGRWDVAKIFAPDGKVVTEMYDLDFDGVVDQVRHP